MNLDELYTHLRQLVSDSYEITMVDVTRYGKATVSISAITDDYCWTRFEGVDLKDALKRAIHKFENPDEDYVDLNGSVWEAKECSIFEAKHIRLFLREVNR